MNLTTLGLKAMIRSNNKVQEMLDILPDLFSSANQQEDLAKRFRQIYKRKRYLNHKDKIEQLEDVFQWLLEDIANPLVHNRGGKKLISEITGIPVSTLSTWRSNLMENPNWRPSRTNYGKQKKIFTDTEEEELIEYIQNTYLKKGLFYSDQDFRYDVLQFYRKKAFQEIEDMQLGFCQKQKIKKFRCSPSFIISFRKRWQQRLRRPNFKRRPNVTFEQKENFISKVKEAIKKYGGNLVFNMDETNYRIVNNKFMTWANKGAKTVNCNINNDIKQGITVLATISKSNKKLPLMILGKGKTMRCINNYMLRNDVWSYFSSTGWTTETVMLKYLEKLKEFVKKKCALIIDTYASHRTDKVKEKAAELGIELIFIPPGSTDELQPLDRKVFGVLKAYAKQLWREHYHKYEGGKIDRWEIADQIIIAWNRISINTLDSAWCIFEFEDFADEEDEEAENLNDEEYIQIFGPDSELY